MTTVSHIFTCPARGDPMISNESVLAVRYHGLKGEQWDRWARHPATYPLRRLRLWIENVRRKEKRPFCVADVSLITLQDIAAINVDLEQLGADQFTPSEMRRSIVLDGALDLNTLLGKTFTVGGVQMRGDNPCDPCKFPPLRSGKANTTAGNFVKAVQHTKVNGSTRGGIRARILSTGTIRIGDRLT